MWLMTWQWLLFLLASSTRQEQPWIVITLNQKLSRKFKMWCKFSSHVKTKSCKKKSHKMRPPVLIWIKLGIFFLLHHLNIEILPYNCTQLNMFCVGLFLKTEDCEVVKVRVYAGKHSTSQWQITLLLLIVINFPTTLISRERWTCKTVSFHAWERHSYIYSNCSNCEFCFKKSYKKQLSFAPSRYFCHTVLS
jgi:hypothetical protein